MVYGNQSFAEWKKWAKMGKLFQKLIVFFWICLWRNNKKISRGLYDFVRLWAKNRVAAERDFRRRTKIYSFGMCFILGTLKKIVQFASSFLYGVRDRWSLPQGAWRGAEVFLHVADKIVGGGETVVVRYFVDSEGSVAQRAADVEGRVARDPVHCRLSAHLAAHLAQVFWRDAQRVGIPRHVAVLHKLASVEQRHKMLHQKCLLVGDVPLAVEFHVEVKEVDDHTLHGVEHRVAVEIVLRQGQAAAYVVEVQRADLLLLCGEVHHRVLEQRQVAAHTVVALRRCHFGEGG